MDEEQPSKQYFKNIFGRVVLSFRSNSWKKRRSNNREVLNTMNVCITQVHTIEIQNYIEISLKLLYYHYFD